MTTTCWGWYTCTAGSEARLRALQSIWPLAPESRLAIGAVELANYLDWWEARWFNRAWLEPLLDPDVPLRSMALLLLAFGLAAKEPGEHGLATDAAITAVDDGRLDGAKLGALMAEILPTGLVKAARWAKTLADVARTSPLHAAAVHAAVSRGLRGEITALPKDLHALVDLLKELVAETGTPVDKEARAFLDQISGSSKLARAARTILACGGPADGTHVDAIQLSVVEHRLARAERWFASAP
jgi:hypothetical protein